MNEEDTEQPKDMNSSIAGAVCLFIGIFVFGIPLSVIGILFALYALYRNEKSPLKWLVLVGGIIILMLSLVGTAIIMRRAY